MGEQVSEPTGGDQTQQALQETARLLMTFLEGAGRFLITNDSMRDLIKEFGERLRQHEAIGNEVETLRAWRRNVTEARAVALEEARLNAPVRRREFAEVPVMTEDQARRIIAICPRRPRF